MNCAAMKILIVDDQPVNLKLLRAVLEADGATVIEAADGVDAMSLLKQVGVDAVISDILMPRMDGYRLCMELRASSQTYDLPFIAYSATYTTPKDEQLMMDVGASRFLRKPVPAALLTFTLGQVVRNRRGSASSDRPRPQAELLKACNAQLAGKLQEKRLELVAQSERVADLDGDAERIRFQWVQMFATALNALFIVQDGKVALASSSSARLMAATSVHELVGRDMGQLLSEGDWARIVERAGLEEQTPANGRHPAAQKLRRLDGETVDVEIGAGNLEYLGRPALLIEARDVTQQKLLLLRLKQTQRLAVLGTLAGGVAHDFNNSLNAIYSNCELAREAAGGNAVLAGHLDGIMAGALHASALARQILASLREEAAELKPVALPQIVLEAANLLRAAAPIGIETQTELGVAPLLILADATQVQRVLINLGLNALHAMAGPGGPGGCLVMSVAAAVIEAETDLVYSTISRGRYALITLRDNGHGMDGETLRRIFEPFFTTNAPGDGCGLGLAVVREIVQTHRGGISVISQRGVGTTFQVYLPLCPDAC
jgi:PAS domain S-box-containing protein